MATRTLEDREGTRWQVWEVVPGQQIDLRTPSGVLLPEHMADGWLCFESAGAKRRLYPVPPAWSEYSETELSALCRAAEPVRPPRHDDDGDEGESAA